MCRSEGSIANIAAATENDAKCAYAICTFVRCYKLSMFVASEESCDRHVDAAHGRATNVYRPPIASATLLTCITMIKNAVYVNLYYRKLHVARLII